MTTATLSRFETVRERIAVHDDAVGELAGFERPAVALQRRGWSGLPWGDTRRAR